MRDILSERNRSVIAEFVRSPVLLAFDYDGTLAPIVTRPEKAVLRSRTRKLLIQLAGKFPCALISGRAYPDLQSRLRGVPIPHLVGNHGIEWQGKIAATQAAEKVVRNWERRLSDALAEASGVELENKRFTLSVHYRHVRDRSRTLKLIQKEIRALRGARVVGGKEVINLLPKGTADKGGALKLLRKHLGCRKAIFLGDDVTDEDVFRLKDPKVLCVRVGRSRTSHAPWFVRDQRAVDLFLMELNKAR